MFQTLKEQAKKSEELEENMKNLTFFVSYKPLLDENCHLAEEDDLGVHRNY